MEHGLTLVPELVERWRAHGTLTILLDFDGTLAPIVPHPDDATLDARCRAAIQTLAGYESVRVAVVSGRAAEDVARRVKVDDIHYAGNHGMEIFGPGVREVSAEARAARPALVRVLEKLHRDIGAIEGIVLEDKGLTLTVHYRQVDRRELPRVRQGIEAVLVGEEALRLTEGKEVTEIRPATDWDKGKAVEFLVEEFGIEADAPVLYIGDDRTDEDAFELLRRRPGGIGIVVADPVPSGTAATSWLKTTEEVGQMLDLLAQSAPEARWLPGREKM